MEWNDFDWQINQCAQSHKCCLLLESNQTNRNAYNSLNGIYRDTLEMKNYNWTYWLKMNVQQAVDDLAQIEIERAGINRPMIV